jgi:UDP-GlcNAc:undecaprenyl-phosphate GlcNAc-1-phosphate transferase
VTNAINLADGLDGLAGGVCLLIFLLIAFLAYQSEQTTVALLSVAVAGAIFGFLRFNTYPATVFMGDTGSQFLGFFAATMALQLTQSGGAFSPLLPLILLGFPVLDTLTVMFERIANGRSPFAADLNHFHHKLMRLGLSHTESVLAIYCIQTVLVVAAFLLRFHSEWLLLTLYLLFSGIVLTVFFLADRRGWRIRRFALVDTVIKGRLKALLSQQVIISTIFRIFQVIFPLLFLATCIAAPRLQPMFIFLYAGILGLVVLVWAVKRDYLGGALRLGVYLLVPVMVYLSQGQPPWWLEGGVLQVYNLSFGLLALFVILTLRFTRRRGFKSTPLDFLILVVALIVPNLPDPQIRSYQLGFIATKIIVFFLSFEVLMGELRGRLAWLGGCIVLGLAIVLVHNLIL